MEKIYRVQMNAKGMPNFSTAKEMVRCKECKYYQDNQEGHYPNEECPWDKGETPNPDDFCSYGERKETDHE